MPAAAQQTEVNAEYAERFAALLAGADTGNANDAEAVSKCRELRRMAKAVDLADCRCDGPRGRAAGAGRAVEAGAGRKPGTESGAANGAGALAPLAKEALAKAAALGGGGERGKRRYRRVAAAGRDARRAVAGRELCRRACSPSLA